MKLAEGSMETMLASPPERAHDEAALQLVRWSGVSLAIGGTLATGAWVLHAIVDPAREGYAEPWWIPLNLALSCGAIFMALGLPGFHARQASRTGLPGLVGLVMLFVGLLLAYVGVQTLEAFSRPRIPSSIAVLAGIAAPIFFLGIVTTSVVTWRAGVYPRAIAITLAVTAMLGLLTRLVTMPAWLGMNVIPALFTAAMAWLGCLLHKDRTLMASSKMSAEGEEDHASRRGRPRRRPLWRSRMLLESALIVLSVLLALFLDEWRRDRQERAELVLAVQGIRAELVENRSAVARARERHLAMHDSLLHYMSVAETPPPRIYYGGLFNPAPVLSTAWQSAREGGSLSRLPYELRVVLARVYDRQLHYRELGDAIIQSAMSDVQRRGAEAVFRDGYANFLLLTEDFANREHVLAESYDSALTALSREHRSTRGLDW